MTLCKGADGYRPHTGLSENTRQAFSVVGTGEGASGTLRADIRCVAAVSHHAGMEAKPTGHQRSPGRQAGRIRTVILIKPHALFCDGIQIGGCVAVIAVATQMIRALSIKVQKQNSHILFLRFGVFRV